MKRPAPKAPSLASSSRSHEKDVKSLKNDSHTAYFHLFLILMPENEKSLKFLIVGVNGKYFVLASSPN